MKTFLITGATPDIGRKVTTEGKRLLHNVQMKVPGEAWLELDIQPGHSWCRRFILFSKGSWGDCIAIPYGRWSISSSRIWPGLSSKKHETCRRDSAHG
ncbi:MAG: hypothetical protein ACN4GW_14950 [Desulforhopalus sp.]